MVSAGRRVEIHEVHGALLAEAAETGEQFVARNRFAPISFGNSCFKLGWFLRGEANFVLSVAADDDVCAIDEPRVIKNDLPGYDFNDRILTTGAAYWINLVKLELG